MFLPGFESIPVSGTMGETNYDAWSEAMKQYELGNSTGMVATKFWLVLRVHKSGFSDKVEMHESIPMLLPKKGCGELVGIAREKPELDFLITPNSAVPDDPRRNYIYLTYRVKIQGQDSWRAFLEFAGEHGMLEADV